MPRPKKPPEPEPRRDWGQGTVTYVPARRRWRARLPRDGSGKRRESYHLTHDEARAWIVRELNRQPDSFDPTQALGKYLNYWYRLRAANWEPQTQRRYRYEMVALKDIGHIPLLKLRGDHVQAALARLLERKRVWRGEEKSITRRYAYNVVSLIRRALADAVKWKIIPDNVVETVTLPIPEKTVTKAWDMGEIREVLKAIVGHRFEAVYLLILWGGLRIGEVVSLRWDQIHEDGSVQFDQAEHTHLKGRPIGSTKREHDRETEIPAHVVARLKVLRAAGPAPMAFPPRPKRDVAYVYVAQRPDGNRWTPRAIRDDWAALVAGLKIKTLTPHGGRRSFGTAHMVAGTPLADLATLMGHSSPSTTAQAYLGSSKDRRRVAAERLAELLEPDKRADGGQIGGQHAADQEG